VSPWCRVADVLVRLRKAVDRRRSVRLQYRDRSGPLSERRVDPLGLVAKAGVWYLIARESAKGYRTFRAQRIAEAEELADSFERPPEFNLESYWNESYDVVLRVQNASVGKLAPYWDIVIERKDESTSTLRIAFPTRDRAIVQLLLLADSVDIISPGELPSAIVERAEHAIRAYSLST